MKNKILDHMKKMLIETKCVDCGVKLLTLNSDLKCYAYAKYNGVNEGRGICIACYRKREIVTKPI